MTMNRTHLALAVAALSLTPLLAPQVTHAQGKLQTIMDLLDAPYGMTLGPDGGLYVAEAGIGGAAGIGPSFVDGNHTTVYYGETGGVAEYVNGITKRVITGLPSLTPAGGGETSGLTDIAFGPTGDLYGVIGLGGVESDRDGLAALLPADNNPSKLGTIVNLTTGQIVSDIVPYETANYATNNGDGTVTEANPYGLTVLKDGTLAVTDGGGNVVLTTSATPGSNPSLLSYVPKRSNPLFTGGPGSVGGPTYQSVPTGITTGPDGSVYVGEFTGFPFPVGAANVYKIDPTTKAMSVVASGFTGIVGISLGPNGDLYVLDTTTTSYIGPPSDGQLFQVDPTTGATTLVTNLAPSAYTGLLAAPDGSFYIASQGAGGGIVQQFTPAPEPSAWAALGIGVFGLGALALKARKRRTA